MGFYMGRAGGKLSDMLRLGSRVELMWSCRGGGRWVFIWAGPGANCPTCCVSVVEQNSCGPSRVVVDGFYLGQVAPGGKLSNIVRIGSQVKPVWSVPGGGRCALFFQGQGNTNVGNGYDRSGGPPAMRGNFPANSYHVPSSPSFSD